MKTSKHLAVGLAIALGLVACGKDRTSSPSKDAETIGLDSLNSVSADKTDVTDTKGLEEAAQQVDQAAQQVDQAVADSEMPAQEGETVVQDLQQASQKVEQAAEKGQITPEKGQEIS